MGLGTKRVQYGATIDLRFHIFLAFFIRFFLIMYAEHHDKTHALKYTDIDYFVFSDGAKEVAMGGSPFDRHTYRYTPFLAWLLLPNVKVNFLFGKFLFSFLDCFSAKIINRVLILDGYSKDLSAKLSLFWLYNPLVIVISSRGNADSILVALILTLVYFLKLRMPILSGFILGISIHFRLYPIIYTLPIYLSFTSKFFSRSLFTRFYPNLQKVKFCISVMISFIIPTCLAIYLYGEEYIEECFLYHIGRTDIRHNFSLYFYMLYLGHESPHPILSLSSFVPQVILLIAFSLKFGNNRDITFALFAQTYTFVTFNKVVTSQYFVWYLLFLPLLLPKVNFTFRKSIFLLSLWFGAQASWLLPAYFLEYRGMNTFVPLWLESIAFFCCNVGILMAFISGYSLTQFTGIHQITKKNK